MDSTRPTGGTNWSEKEEACLAWTSGYRIQGMTYETWEGRRKPIVPDLYRTPTDKFKLMFDSGRARTPLFDALESIMLPILSKEGN